MTVRVRPELIGKKLHRLQVFIDGVHIGEYERSQKADIERKKEEIAAAEADLLALFRKHGTLTVRWSVKDRQKVIYKSSGLKVGVIKKSAWRTPSWHQGA